MFNIGKRYSTNNGLKDLNSLPLIINMAPTKWGILGAGTISNDFVNAIYALNDNSSHEVSRYGIENHKKKTH